MSDSSGPLLEVVERGPLDISLKLFAFIALLAVANGALISTGDISELADTTVLLLLGVFAIVNVTVLVLRRDEVEGPHFRAPSILSVLGALVSLVLIYDKLADDAEVGLRAGLLLALGAVLWLVNRVVSGPRTSEEAQT